jgi:hypothetical protein
MTETITDLLARYRALEAGWQATKGNWPRATDGDRRRYNAEDDRVGEELCRLQDAIAATPARTLAEVVTRLSALADTMCIIDDPATDPQAQLISAVADLRQLAGNCDRMPWDITP